MEFLLILAIAPSIILLVLVWRVDKLEREPISLIVKVAIAGAAVGLVANILEILMSYIVTAFVEDYQTYIIVDNFIGVALIEEAVKMFVIMWFVWRNVEFDCLFDGVVYGTAISLGFAALENVIYAFSFGLSTVLLRAITSIPGHLVFGILMGSMIGYAKLKKGQGKHKSKDIFLTLAIVIATIAHGFYDYLLCDPFTNAGIVWAFYLIAIVIIAVIIVLYMSKHDVRIADTSISDELHYDSPFFGNP